MTLNTAWMQRAIGIVAGVLLATVPAVGLTILGTNFFSRSGADEAGQTAGGAAAVSNSLVRFDAPAVTLQRANPAAVGGAARQDDVVVLRDWQFTAADDGPAGDADDAVANSPQDPLAPIVLALREITALQTLTGPVIPVTQDPFLAFILQLQNFVNSLLLLQEQQLTALFNPLPAVLVGFLEVEELFFRSFFLLFLPSSLITSPDGGGGPVSPSA
jgi:hypothetical protein